MVVGSYLTMKPNKYEHRTMNNYKVYSVPNISDTGIGISAIFHSADFMIIAPLGMLSVQQCQKF